MEQPERSWRHGPFCEAVSLITMGLINNIFFLIVMSSAQRIAGHFHATGMLGVVNWSCSFCGLFAGSLNTWMSSRSLSYDCRFVLNAICMVVGLVGAALAPEFWVACVSILFVGFSCNFGESVALGYLGLIDRDNLVKFWGIGTGVAGFLGAGYSALCIFLDFNFAYSFYALLPLVGIYLVCYFLGIRRDSNSVKPSEENLVMLNGNEGDNVVPINIGVFLRKILYYIVTIDVVYFAQYVIAGAFLDCAQTKSYAHTDDSKSYMFPMLSMARHAGVIISSTSAAFVKFTWLWALVIYQMLNFFVWMSQAMLHWMELWDQFVLIFLVGCIGGLNYVSTYHMILADPQLSAKERELGTNITAVTVNVSVLVAAVFTLISEKTYLRSFVPV